jgi:rhamnosyltransferase
MRRVCAVVVTFHPDALALSNLEALRLQVDNVVVVDNGSDELLDLRQTAETLGLTLIEHGENLGIATALNSGVRRAQQLGAEFVLLFDQDSCVAEGMVGTLVTAFEASAWGERLGILVPRYVDRRFRSEILQKRAASGLAAAMTSGSLLRTETFTRHGYFVDELFIDAVDYEYSLRLRRAGLVIDQCDAAELLHSPGEPRRVMLFGRRLFQCANYSPLRHYYQQRNKIWVAKRYGLAFPGFVAKLFFYSTKDFFKILAGETDKLRKCRFFLRGVWDGLRGRMGRLDAPRSTRPGPPAE